MRVLIISCLSLFLLAVHPVAAEKPAPAFAGAWHWEKGEESLDLVLKQSGTQLTGYHNAVGQQGMKVDAADEGGVPSITGEIKGDTASVRFRSGFPDSTGGGTATLTLKGKYLLWKMTGSTGEHYLPLKARLTRTAIPTEEPAKITP